MNICREITTTIVLGLIPSTIYGLTTAKQWKLNEQISALFNATLSNTTDLQSLSRDVANLNDTNNLLLQNGIDVYGLIGMFAFSGYVITRVQKHLSPITERLLGDEYDEFIKRCKCYTAISAIACVSMFMVGTIQAVVFSATWLKLNT